MKTKLKQDFSKKKIVKTNQNKIKSVGESLVLIMFGKNCIHFQKVQCFFDSNYCTDFLKSCLGHE